MKRLLALETGRAGALGCVLLVAMSGIALAQTTGAVDPTAASAEPAVKQEPSSGGCVPIGLTASGEIVFPFQCKEFIERQKAANQQSAAAQGEKSDAANTPKPATAEQKPDAADENTFAKQPAVAEKPTFVEVKPAVAEEKPAAAEEKAAAAEEKAAAAEENTAAKQPRGVMPKNRKPATAPVQAAPLQKRVENGPRNPTVGPPGCTHFRSYQPASGTYLSFDGRRLACR
ncbi:MAG TPA: BA14K family protein [Xanthobacteraceae bacterium]|nr:BA14K family protein [Xanthobacteraceae bacterium]